MNIDKLDLQSPDLVNDNFEKLAALFPNCVTEGADGKAIDFDLLKQELNHAVIEGNRERYRLEWPGKREAIVTANLPTTQTLRPVREDSVDFDNTENLYIEGDNLEVLKILQESYFGKIKMIYIDPPYNTGTNMIYSNDYSISTDEYLEESGQIENGYRLISNPKTDGRFHSRWLSMMYPRLKLARNLLTDEGFVVLAMDDSEIDNLMKLCDEIFGENNRIGIVTIVHKPEGRNQEKFFGTSNEFALFYAKNKQAANFNNVILDTEKLSEYQFVDAKGKYKKKNFIRRADGKYATREAKPKFWYPIYVSKDLQDISIIRKDDYFEVYPVIDNGVERTWKTLPETFMELYDDGQIIADLEEDKIVISEKMRENQVVKTHWIKKDYHAYHFGTKVLDELLSQKTFDFPKSLFLMIDILKLATEKKSIILDFFSGSATTAHAVMQLNAEDGGNRKFIMVQLPEQTDEKSEAYKAGYKNICEIGKERIRRAGQKISHDYNLSKLNNPDDLFNQDNQTNQKNQGLDIGFRVYRLDSSNMQDVYYRPQDYKQELLDIFTDNIKPDRTPDDLLAQVMLDWGLPLSYKIEQITINGKQVFKVAQNSLFACFDKGIDEAFAKEIAKEKPLRIVFRDNGFADDTAKINVQQLLKQLSPETEMKVI
jgi:adenine-specific DNA-methyltransferase